MYPRIRPPRPHDLRRHTERLAHRLLHHALHRPHIRLALPSGVVGSVVFEKDGNSSLHNYKNTDEGKEDKRLKLEISRAYYLEIEKLRAFVRSAYNNVCRNPNLVRDPVTITYNEKYYHYTLYYYDRAGRLVRTVSPKGVDIDPTRTISTTPSHMFVSRFKTNSLGQVQIKLVPDGGKEEYFYDAKGRLRFVADAVQSSATPKRMSYVRYDRLGRTVETGEVVLPSSGTNATISGAAAAEADDASWPDNSLQRNDVVQYYYDTKATTLPAVISNWTVVHTEQPDFVQKNVRGRLSLALSVPTLDAGYDVDATSTDVVRSFFAYDAQGSLTNYVVDIPVDNTATSDRLIKQTAYQYDAGTGAVTQVDYQPKSEEDRRDRLIHRYHYDAMGRMDTARTSPDGVLFDTDASYSYYKHGPLKREVIGEDMVQGRDYVYTLLGQIKGINHPTLDPTKDPGGDDGTGHVAKDAFAMSFGYYTGDFDRSYGSANSPFNAGSPGVMAPPVSLYSGLVGSWVQNTALMTVPSGQTLLRNNEQMGESFRYDVLGRLRTTTTAMYNGTSWVQENADGYSSAYSYDQNSNLRRIRRHTMTSATTGTWLDDATTTMLSTSSNVVEQVADVWPGLSYYPLDLGNSSPSTNAVDQSGNVITGGTDANQTSAEISSIDRPKNETLRDGTIVVYLRDPFGRVVRQNETLAGEVTRYFSLGVGGEIQAVYLNDDESLILKDRIVYGLGRLGGLRAENGAYDEGFFTRTIGDKLYECTDHLGSVRAVVSDIKIVANSELLPEIVSTADYEAYGLVRPNRSVSSLTSQYDFGFQGMRKTVSRLQINEYTTEFRQYDAALGRWNSHDPLQDVSAQPYEGLGSSPVWLTDWLGLSTGNDLPPV